MRSRKGSRAVLGSVCAHGRNSRRTAKAVAVLSSAVLGCISTTSVTTAATQTYVGGTHPWDTSTTALWSGVTDTSWDQGNDALFTSTSTLTLAPSTTIQANSLTDTTSNATLTISPASGAFLELGPGLSGTSIASGNSATIIINSALELNGSQTWNIGGNGGLTVGGNITDAAMSTVNISTTSGENGKTITLTGTNSFAALTLNPAGTGQVVNQNAGGLTLSGALTSSSNNSTFNSSVNDSFGSLMMTGGTVNLSGTNTITSGTTLNGGTLSITTDANFGGTGSQLTFGGGTLLINGTTETTFGARSVSITAGTTANINVASASNTFNFNTNIASTSGGIAKSGLGSITLSGNNAYTGATTITDGTLTLDYSTNTGTKLGSNGALTLNGATLTSLGTQAGTEVAKGLVIGAGDTLANPIPSAITGNSANTFNFSSGSFTHTAGGVIAFASSGGPTIDLSGTAGAIVGAGFATIGDNYVSVSSTNGPVTAFTAYNNDSFTSGTNTNVTATGDSWANGVTINSLRIGASGGTTTTLGGTGTITSGGILVASTVGANLTDITGGTLATTSNGDLIVTQNSSGTLEIDSTLALGSGRLVMTGTGGGDLKLTAGTTFGQTTDIYNGTVEYAPGSGVTLTQSGAVVGAGGIIKSGLGTVNLSNGSNTYAGPTSIQNGIFEFSNNSSSFGNGNGLVTLGASGAANNTVVSISQNAKTFGNAFATAGTGGTNTIQVQGGGQGFTFTGGFTLGNNLTLSTFGGSDSITVSGSNGISGPGNLVTSSSTTSLGGNAATGSGSSGGAITISSAVGNSGAVTNNGTGTGLVTISGTISSNVSSINQSSSTSNLLISGTNSATGGFATGTGAINVNSGTLQLGSTTAFGSGNILSVASGAIFDMNGTSGTVAGINNISSVGGAIINSSTVTTGRTLTLGGSGNYTFAGVYSGGTTASTAGTGALTVALTGSGVQTLSGTSIYTGLTTVSGGTLDVTGAYTGGGPLTTSGTGVFQVGGGSGAGTFGNLTNGVTAGVVLGDGSGVGTLTLAGTVTGAGTIVGGNTSYSTLVLTGSPTIATVVGGTGTNQNNINLIKNSSTTAELTALNTYTGSTTINGGTLYLFNTNLNPIISASNYTVNPGTVLQVEATNSPGSTYTIGGALTLDGGSFVDGTADAPNSSSIRTETGAFFGALNLGVGYNKVVENPGANGNTTGTVQFGSLGSHVAGSTVLFAGYSLGGSASGGPAQIMFTTSPLPQLVGGGGAVSTTTTSILPYAISDYGGYSSTNGAAGVYANIGNGSDFATVISGGLIEPLTNYATSITSGATALNNVKITDAAASGINSATTINSLILNSASATGPSPLNSGATVVNGTTSVDGTEVLTINSGAILVTTTTAVSAYEPAGGASHNNFGGLFTNNATIGTSGLTIAFGSQEGVITTAGTSTLTFAPTSGGITGSGGLTKSGAGVLTLQSASSYSGVTTIDAGTLTVNSTSNANAALTNTSAISIANGATLKLISTVAGPTTVNLINDSANINVTGANAIALNLNGNTEAVSEFIINGIVQPVGTYSATGGTGANATADESYFVSSGNSGFLNVTAVPEPTSLGLVALSGLGLMRRRRTAVKPS